MMMILASRSVFSPSSSNICFVSSFRFQSASVRRHSRSLHHVQSKASTSTFTFPTNPTFSIQRQLSSQRGEDLATGTSTNKKRLDYVHSFHAGNFADVTKHVILVQLLQHMQKKKNKPIGYVETHSGAGLYALANKDEGEFKTEHQRGIVQLLKNHHQDSKDDDTDNLPLPIATYLKIVESFQDDSCSDLIYPGSPLFAATLLSQQETKPRHSMRLYDKFTEPWEQLQTNLETFFASNHDNTIESNVLLDNGYTALADYARTHSNLPGRALIVIDPPYQYGSDTDQIAILCQTLQEHWRSARIAIWHPVRTDHADKLKRLYGMLRESVPSQVDILTIEVYPPPLPEEEGRKEDVGTGMILIQPPYGIDKECQEEVLPKLLKMLYPQHKEGEGWSVDKAIRVEWL